MERRKVEQPPPPVRKSTRPYQKSQNEDLELPAREYSKLKDGQRLEFSSKAQPRSSKALAMISIVTRGGGAAFKQTKNEEKFEEKMAAGCPLQEIAKGPVVFGTPSGPTTSQVD